MDRLTKYVISYLEEREKTATFWRYQHSRHNTVPAAIQKQLSDCKNTWLYDYMHI